MTPKLRWTLVGVAAVAALAAGVYFGMERAGTPASTAQAGAALAGLALPDPAGKEQRLDQWRGKVVVVNFWATWCAPCREEIPSLVELQQNYGDQLVVLGVSIDDPLSKLKPYAAEMHMNYPVLVGKDRQDVQDAYGPLFGIPVSVFVDRDGRIWKRHSGIASKEQFEREIKALL